MPLPAKEKYTPSEALLLEVLVARFRLGQLLWTFDSRNKPALKRLEDKALVYTLSPNVPNTIRASFTGYALATHGEKWFHPQITADLLPEINHRNWEKHHALKLAELLSDPASTVNPKAVNAAHLLMIQMMARHHLVYSVKPRVNLDVLLEHVASKSSVEVFSQGPTYRLSRAGQATSTTTRMDEVLWFTSTTPLR